MVFGIKTQKNKNRSLWSKNYIELSIFHAPQSGLNLTRFTGKQ